MRSATCLLPLLACPVFSAEPVYSWRSRADDPDRVYLYRDGKQIGGWCYRAKHYRPFDGETWGPATEASPVPPPGRGSMVMSISRQSPPYRRFLRPIKSRVDAAIDQYVEANAARWVEEAVGQALAETMKSIAERLYYFDLDLSEKLFAHIEMGGKLNDKPDSDDYKLTKKLMTIGSARVFLAEKAKFADKLREEKFSDPVLTTIRLETVDDLNPTKEDSFQPDAVLQSVRLFRTRHWDDDPPTTIAPDTPSVLLIANHRTKDAKETIPVTVHCSLTYLAQKEGKTFTKTLSFDLYLEKLERQGDAYLWKVRNVQYQ